MFAKYTDLPIQLTVDEPETIGIDRLCGAVAAQAMVSPGRPAITVNVGTAVTVEPDRLRRAYSRAARSSPARD